MDNILQMSATKRHGLITKLLNSSTIDLLFKNELADFSESVALVYYGTRKSIDSCKLINAEEIENISELTDDIIYELNYVVPDYMYFKKNKYIINKKETRIVGCPDLIVEVWSDGNILDDREFKKYLYATSPTTEQWYIEQNSNRVECYYGTKKLDYKNLNDILVSKDGIEFDLRRLKLN